jgi:predicted transglutaminase-like cysteine proteinase
LFQKIHALSLGALAAALLGLAAPAAAGEHHKAQMALAAPLAADRAPAFGARRFVARALRGVPQWRRVLDETARHGEVLADCLAHAARCATPALRAWRDTANAVSGRGRLEVLVAVNRFFNRWPYKTDSQLYRAREYWATPDQFLARSGDCEDFAIVKFFALRALGLDNGDMRIALVRDSIRGIGHAVLTVDIEGDTLVLDSLSDTVLSHRRYRHYRPFYLVDETTLWTVATPSLDRLVERAMAEDAAG